VYELIPKPGFLSIKISELYFMTRNSIYRSKFEIQVTNFEFGDTQSEFNRRFF